MPRSAAADVATKSRTIARIELTGNRTSLAGIVSTPVFGRQSGAMKEPFSDAVNDSYIDEMGQTTASIEKEPRPGEKGSSTTTRASWLS